MKRKISSQPFFGLKIRFWMIVNTIFGVSISNLGPIEKGFLFGSIIGLGAGIALLVFIPELMLAVLKVGVIPLYPQSPIWFSIGFFPLVFMIIGLTIGSTIGYRMQQKRNQKVKST